jgi:hypothetical protein
MFVLVPYRTSLILDVALIARWEVKLDPEDTAAFVEDAGLSVRHKISYFAEITPFRLFDGVEPIFQIERIVNIKGDTRRGRKPFPHPFPAPKPQYRHCHSQAT